MSVLLIAPLAVSLSYSAAAAASDPAPAPSGWMQDAQTASSEGYALSLAQTYGHRVQVLADTTETAVVYAQPDGTMQETATALPVRVRQADGSWRPIDTALEDSGAYLQPTATTVPTRLSNGGPGPMAQVQAASGQWLSVSWPGGTLPTPRIEDDSAVYPEVYPGVDLRLSANSEGFSEVLIIKSAQAARDPQLADVRFGIVDGSLTSVQVSGDALAFKSTDGTVQIQSGAPTWWDSAGVGADADGPSDNSGESPLPPSATTVTQSSIAVNASAIASTPGTVYPVFVDPPFTGRRAAYVFVDSAYPDVDYLNGGSGGNKASDGFVHVGYVDAAGSDDGNAHKARGFFDMNTQGLNGKKIISAAFNINLYYSWSCTATVTDLWTTASNTWFGGQTTWNHQPGEGTKFDTQSGAFRKGQCDNGGSDYKPMGFDATGNVTFAAAHSEDTIVELTADHEDCSYPAGVCSWKKFGNNPNLQVTYDSSPSTPGGLSVRPCYVTCTGNVISHPTASAPLALTAKASDPDGGNLKYVYELYHSHSTSSPGTASTFTSANVAQNASYTWDVSTSVVPLNANGDYEYRVRAYDGTVYSAYSAWQQFTIDSSAPPAPDASLNGATTDPDTPEANRQGRVGSPVSANFATPTNSGAVEIVYSMLGIVPTYSKPPACNASANGVVVVCKSGSSWPTQTIAALDTSDTLSLVSFDAAGNRSSTNSEDFFVQPNLAAVNAGHSWRADPAVSGSITDSAAVSPQALTENSTIARHQDTPNPDYYAGYDPVNNVNLPNDVPVDDFDATATPAPTASSSSSVLNTAQSFTLGAWVKLSGGTGSYRSFLSTSGTNISTIVLQTDNTNKFKMCVVASDTASASYRCAFSAETAVAGSWYFIVGQWDAVNHEARLSVNGGDWTSAYAATTPTAPGPLVVGSALAGPSDVQRWSGSVYYPFAIPGIATQTELSDMSNHYAAPSTIED